MAGLTIILNYTSGIILAYIGYQSYKVYKEYKGNKK